MKINSSFFGDNLDDIWEDNQGRLFIDFIDLLFGYKDFGFAKKVIFLIEVRRVNDAFR